MRFVAVIDYTWLLFVNLIIKNQEVVEENFENFFETKFIN
jgi:hypothetical protein